MQAPRHVRLTATCGVLLALVGVWLGHAIEYVRVWGGTGFDRALTGPTHAYMVPVGVALGIAAALTARQAWVSWQRLARRLDSAALALRLALRGRGSEAAPGASIAAPASWEARMLSLGALLAIAQVCLYLLQENLEALATGRAMPGLGAVSGVHWAAALIQLDIAFVLLAAVALFVRRFRARIATVGAIESLVRLLRGALRARSAPRPHPLFDAAPHEWLRPAAWSRPPPCAAVAP
jgi:hypothetical protein